MERFQKMLSAWLRSSKQELKSINFSKPFQPNSMTRLFLLFCRFLSSRVTILLWVMVEFCTSRLKLGRQHPLHQVSNSCHHHCIGSPAQQCALGGRRKVGHLVTDGEEWREELSLQTLSDMSQELAKSGRSWANTGSRFRGHALSTTGWYLPPQAVSGKTSGWKSLFALQLTLTSRMGLSSARLASTSMLCEAAQWTSGSCRRGMIFEAGMRLEHVLCLRKSSYVIMCVSVKDCSLCYSLMKRIDVSSIGVIN